MLQPSIDVAVRFYERVLCYYLHNYDAMGVVVDCAREVGHLYHFLHGINLI